MKKYILLCAILTISLQLNGAATGFLRSSATQARRFIPGLTQQTQRFMATQTPKSPCPTGSGFKNMLSGTQRQFSNAWSQYRKPITLGALGLGGAGLAYNANILSPDIATAKEEQSNAGQSKNYPFTFDREHMLTFGDHKSEDTWSSCSNDKYPTPKANTQPWPTKDLFLKRLTKIEQKAEQENEQKDFLNTFKNIEAQAKKFGYKLNLQNGSDKRFKYHIDNWRCLATSRFEPNKHLSMRSYTYTDKQTGHKISWTVAFGDYYVKKFNVKPSQEFYDWVMNNPDGN